jgi:serine/threonine protein kinase
MNQKEFEQRYRFEKNIGSGGFSEVYQAKERKTGRYVAIKKSQVKEEWKGFELMREYELANRMPHHDNIARYNACYRYDTGMGGIFDFAVLNYYEYGNLEQFLKRNTLNTEQMEQMVRGILEGLIFLHKRDIIHRDFKAQNILIDREHGVWIPKITDFGLSRAFLNDDSVHNSAIAMSYAYAAPEQLKGEKISKKVDIWAMGVLIYRIVANELPFQVATETDNRSAANAELTRQILSGTLPEKLNLLPQPYRSMIRRCLVHDTLLRLGDIEKLLAMLDGLRVGSGNSDSAPKPAAETEVKTTKITDSNPDDATVLIDTNEPTIRLEAQKVKNESKTDLGTTDPIERPKLRENFKAARINPREDSAYIRTLTKLGLYIGNKPAQRTLWYWTYIPIGVFVTSWAAFFINGNSIFMPEAPKEGVQMPINVPTFAPPAAAKPDVDVNAVTNTLIAKYIEEKRIRDSIQAANAKVVSALQEANKKLKQEVKAKEQQVKSQDAVLTPVVSMPVKGDTIR